MKKLLLALVISVMAFGFTTSVQAQTNIQEVNEIVEEANERISFEVEKAQFKGAQLVEKRDIKIEKIEQKYVDGLITYEKYVKKIDKVNAKFEKELNKVIKKVVKTTDRISAKTIKKANELLDEGYEVICEYEPYVIGDRTVMIDPIRVHRW